MEAGKAAGYTATLIDILYNRAVDVDFRVKALISHVKTITKYYKKCKKMRNVIFTCTITAQNKYRIENHISGCPKKY